MEPALAVITLFAADFAPKGWAYCRGQLLSISQNQALFSLLGTTYGGDGRTTFGLPDFRGRSGMGTGQGSGLSNRTLGEVTGTDSVTLLSANLAAHTHTGTVAAASTTGAGSSDEPPGMIFAAAGGSHFAAGGQGSMGGVTATLATAGASQPFGIQQPYLAVTFIIALQGIFPSRN